MSEILVIDDEAQVRQLVFDILSFSGYRTRVAASGGEGLDLIHEHQPDLIFCDVHMPGLDGFSVLNVLRRDPATQTIPFIFLTGRDDRDAMRRGMELGADDYLTKPFEPAELLAAVQTQMKKQAAVAQKYETTLRLVRRNIVYALPHELRTPLFGITGFADLLRSEWETIEREQIYAFADQILAAGSRLERLIENFLVYAQIEMISGDPEQIEQLRNHITANTTCIVSEVSETVAVHYNRLADLSLELCQVAVQISEQDVRKIVYELVDNAFKFSQAGSKIYVSMTAEPDTFTLSVSDSGRGMTAEQIEAIGAFMQFDRLLYEQQGMGLGLSVVKRLSTLHHGCFDIHSTLDRGTTVRVEFPLS